MQYSLLAQPHGLRIWPIVTEARTSLKTRQNTLSRKERELLTAKIDAVAQPYVYEGVDFSRIQPADVLCKRDTGKPVEFEALGPYLSAYVHHDGIMTMDNLLPEDAIGLELCRTLGTLFPDARLISLCDEYNLYNPYTNAVAVSHRTQGFTKAAKENFKSSLIQLFKDYGAISASAVAGKDYLLIPESTKAADANHLVALLDAEQMIERNGEEITFVNPDAENPLYSRITLRTKRGRWLCEALDAATYIKPENLSITHIVALPDYMKEQQDKVWEILRILGIRNHQYHNIFYDTAHSPQHISQIVLDTFMICQQLAKQD